MSLALKTKKTESVKAETSAVKNVQRAGVLRSQRADFSAPANALSSRIQAKSESASMTGGKVSIGEPNDRYEQEADRVAEHVEAGTVAPSISRLAPGGLSSARRKPEDESVQEMAVQREEDESVQEMAVQREEDESVQEMAVQREEDESVQEMAVQRRSAAHNDEPRQMEEAASRAIRNKGPGSPLQAETKGRLEHSMGADLSEVRVHEGASAASEARRLNAHAFTHKNHVWLGAGQSQGNLRLMGHEVTHVMQQGAVVRRKPDTETVVGVEPTLEAPKQDSVTPPPAGASKEMAMGGGAAPVVDVSGKPASASAGKVGVDSKGAEGGTKHAKTEGKAEAVTIKSDVAAPAKSGVQPVTDGLDVQRPTSVDSDADGQARLNETLGNVATEAATQQAEAATPEGVAAAANQTQQDTAAATPVPENEAESVGQTGKIESMDEQEAGSVEKDSFIALMEKKLEEMDMPSSPEKMEAFSEGGSSGLRSAVVGDVKAQSDNASQGLTGASDAPVTAPPARQATALPEQASTPVVANMQSENVLPPAKSDEETSLEPEREATERRMAQENLSEDRLAKANDPRFGGLQGARTEVHHNADTAPGQFREAESTQLADGQQSVREEETTAAEGMMSSHALARTGVAGQQQDTMSKEEKQRKKIADDINQIFATTETAVKAKLTWLDGEVDRLFDEGEKKARDRFESHVKSGMTKWKDKRYGSSWLNPIGKLVDAGTWVYDKLKGIDHFPEVQQIFTDGRKLYLDGLKDVIRQIATTVDETLGWCKSEIKKGKGKVTEYVKTLDDSVKKFAEDTVSGVMEKFNSLAADVDAKKEALADKLTQKYKESRDSIDARIEEMRAANKGIVDAFVGKLKAVLEALDNFRKQLMSMMSQAGEVIELILEDPIGFLKNLIAAIKGGIELFAKNIWAHLKTGVMGWMFGAFASMGINIPSDFSLKSVAGFIMEILGVTWDRIRPKIARVVGERNLAVLEKVAGYVKTLFTEGPKGLWEEIKDDLSSLKEFVLNAVKEWVITKIVTAAITKIVSMLNPAGAIVQAIMAIYNIVMFFVERIDQIMSLVQAIISSLGKIVRGDIGQAAAFVEKTMALALPVIISFLARLLGIGGIAKKVQGIIKKVQKKVDKAVDKAIKKIATRMKKMFGGNKGSSAAANPAQNKQRAISEVNQALKKGIRRTKLKSLLVSLKKKYDLKEAYIDKGDDVHIINSPDTVIKASPPNPRSKNYQSEEMRVSDPQGAKGRRTKSASAANIVGVFSAQAPSAATPAGPIKKAFTEFQYPEMPDNAPRPTSAKAELFGRLDKITRAGDSTQQGMAGKFGEIEARVKGKSHNYDGGHLIANEFGGPDDYRNFVPMKRSINQHGVFKKMEEWARAQITDLPSSVVGTLPVDLTMVVQPIYGRSVSVNIGTAAKRLGSNAKSIAYGTHIRGKGVAEGTVNKLEAKIADGDTLTAKELSKLTNARQKLANLTASDATLDSRAEQQGELKSTRLANTVPETINFPSRIPRQIKISVGFKADSLALAEAVFENYEKKVDPKGTKTDAAGDRRTTAMGHGGSKGNVETNKDPVLLPEGVAASGGSGTAGSNSGVAGGAAPAPVTPKKYRKDFSITE